MSKTDLNLPEGWVPEVPRRTPRFDAILYEWGADTLDGVLRRTLVPKPPRAITYHANWGYLHSRHFAPLPLPDGMDRWSAGLLTSDDPAAALAEDDLLVDLEIGPDAIQDLLPDVIQWSLPMVRANVRVVLEAVDRGGSYFVPAVVRLEGSGAPVRGDWSYWLVRRQLKRDKSDEAEKAAIPRITPPTLTRTSRLHPTAWELYNDPTVRAVVSEMPVWCHAGRYSEPLFNRAAFAALKAAGVTGLVERTNVKDTEAVPGENIGWVE
ncbi:MAG: hypothetical protein AAF919_02485 [Pseudomonadota bacterium]